MMLLRRVGPLTISAAPELLEPIPNVAPTIDTPASFTVVQGAIALVPGVQVADADGGQLTVTIQDVGVVANLEQVSGTAAEVNSQLQELEILGDVQGAATLTFIVDDGQTQVSAQIVGTVTAPAAGNVPPGITISSPTTLLEEGQSTSATVTIVDPDAGNSPLLVSLELNTGRIGLRTTANITIDTGADGGQSVSFTGLLPDLNNAIDLLTLSTDVGAAASTPLVLTATVNDQHAVDEGMATRTHEWVIAIAPTVDPPVEAPIVKAAPSLTWRVLSQASLARFQAIVAPKETRVSTFDFGDKLSEGEELDPTWVPEIFVTPGAIEARASGGTEGLYQPADPVTLAVDGQRLRVHVNDRIVLPKIPDTGQIISIRLIPDNDDWPTLTWVLTVADGDTVASSYPIAATNQEVLLLGRNGEWKINS